MLKNKILESIGGSLDEWLLGFNSKDDLSVSMFSSEKVNVKNAIINSDRVNEALYEHEIPMRFKAGMIGKLSVKTSLLALFSESIKIEVNDIHIILGPNSDFFSEETDFNKDPKGAFYDIDDQITNLVMMHEIVEEQRKPEKMRYSQWK